MVFIQTESKHIKKTPPQLCLSMMLCANTGSWNMWDRLNVKQCNQRWKHHMTALFREMHPIFNVYYRKSMIYIQILVKRKGKCLQNLGWMRYLFCKWLLWWNINFGLINFFFRISSFCLFCASGVFHKVCLNLNSRTGWKKQLLQLKMSLMFHKHEYFCWMIENTSICL